MYSWRISKYNPQYRNEKGEYKRHEWTSFSDIGKEFNGGRLSIDNYIKIESLYIDIIILFLEIFEIPYLKIKELEKYSLNQKDIIDYKKIYPDAMLNLFYEVSNNKKYSIQEVDYISRLVLREHLWLKFAFKKEVFIHFGYDYYMYIGSKVENKLFIEKFQDIILFIEEYSSPYLKG